MDGKSVFANPGADAHHVNRAVQIDMISGRAASDVAVDSAVQRIEFELSQKRLVRFLSGAGISVEDR